MSKLLFLCIKTLIISGGIPFKLETHCSDPRSKESAALLQVYLGFNLKIKWIFIFSGESQYECTTKYTCNAVTQNILIGVFICKGRSWHKISESSIKGLCEVRQNDTKIHYKMVIFMFIFRALLERISAWK